MSRELLKTWWGPPSSRVGVGGRLLSSSMSVSAAVSPALLLGAKSLFLNVRFSKTVDVAELIERHATVGHWLVPPPPPTLTYPHPHPQWRPLPPLPLPPPRPLPRLLLRCPAERLSFFLSSWWSRSACCCFLCCSDCKQRQNKGKFIVLLRVFFYLHSFRHL